MTANTITTAIVTPSGATVPLTARTAKNGNDYWLTGNPFLRGFVKAPNYAPEGDYTLVITDGKNVRNVTVNLADAGTITVPAGTNSKGQAYAAYSFEARKGEAAIDGTPLFVFIEARAMADGTFRFMAAVRRRAARAQAGAMLPTL